jgi:hypothetical protein
MTSDSDSDANSNDDTKDEKASDYSSSDESVDSDLGFDALGDLMANQKFEDDTKLVYDDYKYCVSRDEKYVATDELTRETRIKKLQFIFEEVINDMGIAKGTFMDYVETVLIIMGVIWFRMVVHYLGQYVFLKLINAPVTNLSYSIFTFYRITLEYAFWNEYQELGVITVGYLSNTIVFSFLMLTCYLSQTYIFCFPVKLCKIIAWYGLATMLDFFIVNVIDFADQNTNGDIFKLYNYYQKRENAGVIGLFLTLLIQFALLILNFFIFYNYIAFVHCDARLSDIYLRISGIGRGYHIPLDNEISWNYLKQSYSLGEINNNRIVVNRIRVPHSFLPKEPVIAKSYQFQRFRK